MHEYDTILQETAMQQLHSSLLIFQQKRHQELYPQHVKELTVLIKTVNSFVQIIIQLESIFAVQAIL